MSEERKKNVHARRATEYKIKIRYPFTVLSAPFVLALPVVVLSSMHVKH